MQHPAIFAIGSPAWPGLSKLAEEAGETLQVIGKLMGTGGDAAHWDGTDLRARLVEEISDLMAACEFVVTANRLGHETVNARRAEKLALFFEWHHALPDSPSEQRDPGDVCQSGWCGARRSDHRAEGGHIDHAFEQLVPVPPSLAAPDEQRGDHEPSNAAVAGRNTRRASPDNMTDLPHDHECNDHCMACELDRCLRPKSRAELRATIARISDFLKIQKAERAQLQANVLNLIDEKRLGDHERDREKERGQ